MSDWDARFLRLAEHISTWSKDPSTQVGCVISEGKFIRSLGFNGFPSLMKDDSRLDNRDEKHLWVIHAEENAIINSQSDLRGCTAYIWPLHPCTRCASKLVQSGITRVVAREPSEHHKERYQLDKVSDLFHECGIDFQLVRIEK